MTFWQKMTLSIIVHVAYIDNFSSNEEATDFVARSQNFLICLEMLFAAVAHCFVFPPEEWAEGYREREEMRRKRQSEFETHFGDSVALGDFIRDVKSVMASKRRRRLRKRKTGPNKTLNLNEGIEEEEGHVGDDDFDNMDKLAATVSSESRDSDALDHRNRMDSTESFDDEYDPQFSIDEDEREEISRKPFRSANSSVSSLGSIARDDGSWARIEQYINEHENVSKDCDQKGPLRNDASTKEIV